MRFFPVFPLLVLIISVAFAFATENQSPVPSAMTEPSSKSSAKADPRITPEYLALLKNQADERKAFYQEQSRRKQELTLKNAKERQELLESHRAARKKFGDENHTHEERSIFFRSQRDEMGALEARHRSGLKEHDAELKKSLVESHTKQRKEREELAARLVRERAK